jgi:heme A synthase
MTDSRLRLFQRVLDVTTALAAVNAALLLAFGAKSLFLLAGFAALAACAAVQLCARPRLLRPWAILCVVATFVLLGIGQLVTSFGAGMADPVWPTEPWYVTHTATQGEKDKFRKDYAFFLEHSHRIAGWSVGILVSALAVGVLWTEPRKAARWAALAGLFVLLMGYGEFHRKLMEQRDPDVRVVLPVRSVATVGLGLAVMFGSVISGFFTGARGTGLRFYGAMALVAVMVQGLLGGFRVKLNALVGADLAAVHGVFAQVVLGLLVSVAVVARRVPAGSRSGLARWAMALAHLIFLQVIFGAWVRHFPAALPQRLHFLTAFAATALAVWLLRAIFADPAARSRAGWVAWALAAVLVLQILLGVEAWMARFGQYVPPSMVKVTAQGGATRSLHALVGSAVWAASLALALRLRTGAPAVHKLEQVEGARPGPRPVARTPQEAVPSRFRGDAQ